MTQTPLSVASRSHVENVGLAVVSLLIAHTMFRQAIRLQPDSAPLRCEWVAVHVPCHLPHRHILQLHTNQWHTVLSGKAQAPCGQIMTWGT